MMSSQTSVSARNLSDYTPDLTALMARATLINRQYENNFDVSFTSLLLAFLFASDPLSRHFQSYVREKNVNVSRILEELSLNQQTMDDIMARSYPPELTEKPLRLTSSIETVFSIAEEYRYQVSQSEAFISLDVRHVMGVYIYKPGGHLKELEQWGFNQEGWSNSFIKYIKGNYPLETDYWMDLHRDTFSTEPVDDAGSVENGPSTHIATDRWTIDDALGYRAYAYAIYRFMTHKQTKAPLTISIQAPWGGGKTSLMRMIQDYLDPDAKRISLNEEALFIGKITIKKVIDEIKEWQNPETSKELPSSKNLQSESDPTSPKWLTIWFNAWKYESTNQVWAGLADTIIQQIAERLPIEQRELFWLHLNLKRVDTNTIRNKIYEHIFNIWWQDFLPWLWGTGIGVVISSITILLGGLTQAEGTSNVGWIGLTLSGLTGVLSSVLKYLKAKREIEEQPAAISLGEYLNIPDYRSELGFIHFVEADLRHVFASVPKNRRPLVIFIDDLDRCSPDKVAEVIEGINLFLGGDFPDCMFVLGMDAEMVAAALEAAHEDVINRLPVDAATPMGWRFMDKFVQLPFVIPPADVDDIQRYTTALLTTQKERDATPDIDQHVQSLKSQVNSLSDLEPELERIRNENKLTDEQTENLRNHVENTIIQKTLDNGIKSFSDDNPEIRKQVAAAAEAFSRNPREMKRFVNAFRFQYFLWWAQRAQKPDDKITLDQLQRWVILSMKWPEVVRWIRRSGGREHRSLPTSDKQVSRLAKLELMGEDGDDLAKWHQAAQVKIHLDPKITPWLNDDDLRKFFYDEFHLNPKDLRLSANLGKGLW